ncbi:MAG TPA: RluA family pseudouridine synthase [Phycisphaerae bacterium]|nr:RluA family pseudouridine synthase [Phycisphaerae bacterium]
MPQYSVAPNDDIEFCIRFSDEHLLVVDKPAGVVTQPGKGHARDSLLNGLFGEYGNLLQNLGEERTWGLLHRLDKETSGLVLVALRTRAYDNLREQFEKRLVRKTYWAIVSGTPSPAQGVIQEPLAEVVGTRKLAVVRRDGKQAITAYKVLQKSGDVSLVEARPKTGRLHQIRIHMAEHGNPLLGDDVYGGKKKMPAVPRLCLHAASLSFLHPETGHRITVQSPWPDDLAKTAKRLGIQIPELSSE